MFRSRLGPCLVAGMLVVTACSNANPDNAAKLAADSGKAGTPATASESSSVAGRTPATPAAPRTRARTAPAGTTVHLAGVTDVTSQKDQVGKPYTARVTSAVVIAGDTVIPVGAELVGHVTVLRPAGSPGDTGSMMITFTGLRIGTVETPIESRVISMGTRSVARGVTVDDAAKVGVGAAAGAVAGRIIGGNRTGTAVGAVAGGAAGAVVANRTKDHDIVLSPGSAIEIALAAPFTRR
jgi:hypothetical protein